MVAARMMLAVSLGIAALLVAEPGRAEQISALYLGEGEPGSP
jgi:hypothetical protein